MLSTKKRELYNRSFESAVNEYLATDYSIDSLKKMLYFGVHEVINAERPGTLKQANEVFNMITAITDLTKRLTPKEFMRIFPIEKEFDGEKHQMKDYFSTMEYIDKIGIDNKIGNDSYEFLMEYHNRDIMMFCVRSMTAMSDIRRYQGKPSIMEEWADKNGIETFTMHTDSVGKEYVMDSKGRTSKVNKPRKKVSYLKLVK